MPILALARSSPLRPSRISSLNFVASIASWVGTPASLGLYHHPYCRASFRDCSFGLVFRRLRPFHLSSLGRIGAESADSRLSLLDLLSYLSRRTATSAAFEAFLMVSDHLGL